MSRKKITPLEKRRSRVRYKLAAVRSDRPFLSLHRTENHMYAQIFVQGRSYTLVAASTLEKEVKNQLKTTSNTKAAHLVGELIAQRALKAGITHVVFDRSGYLYHGRVKALAEAARQAGLNF